MSDKITELSQIDLTKRFFASGRDDLLGEFYIPCLDQATRYDRAVGYLRSSVFALTGIPYSNFAQRGGKVRIICSPDLAPDDAAAIADGYERRSTVEAAMQRELDLILEHGFGTSVLTLLATLVAVGTLDVKIAVKQQGIFHSKVGIFHDDQNAVSFQGSANESWSAWTSGSNDETFDVFTTWSSDADAARVSAHQEYFDAVWDGKIDGTDVYDLPDAIRKSLLQYSHKDGLEGLTGGVIQQRPAASKMPKLYPHQEQALADWHANSCIGLLEHATGSGKTITALAAINEWMARQLPVVILVPSDLLLKQWARELRLHLAHHEPAVLFVGGPTGRSEWEMKLASFVGAGGGPRAVIATLQSASQSAFIDRINLAQDLLLVIDEAHRAGSDVARRVFEINAVARLGLSATPERFGDPEGTAAILDYFERVLEPVFTLTDAIREKRLTPYTYHVHYAHLTGEEQSQWDRLTLEIGKAYSQLRSASPPPDASARLQLLQIKRARIVKKAEAKTAIATNVIAKNYKTGESWLVYCEDQDQLGKVLAELKSRSLPAFEYHSSMDSDRAATMKYFEENGGIVVAIRCLDEGVDIPRVSHALILASSQNPREFIQRRGRVLRKYPHKLHAAIHDILALPSDEEGAGGGSGFLANEIARALLFARDGMNRATELKLARLARDMGIDIEKTSNEGSESDLSSQ